MRRACAAATAAVLVAGGGCVAARAAVATPTVTSVSPRIGAVAGGTRVTVHGTGFTHVSSVHFGKAAGTAIHVRSATSLQVTSPAHYEATVDVRVQTSAGTSAVHSTDAFSYHYRPHPVRSLTVADTTGTSVLLQWSPAIDSADRLEVYRRSGSSAPTAPVAKELVARLPTSATSYRDTDLTPATGHAYSVFAVRYGGALYSDPASVSARTSPADRPATPAQFQTQRQDPVSCATPDVFIPGYGSTDRLAVVARLDDPDDDSGFARLHLELGLVDLGTDGTGGTTLIRPGDHSHWSSDVSPGDTAVASVFGFDLVDGHEYGVYGITSDGTHSSAPTAQCRFWVDSMAPDRPTVTPPDETIHAGAPATFTVASSDPRPAAGGRSLVRARPLRLFVVVVRRPRW